MKYESVIVGAGFAGAVTARRLAEDGGRPVLVLERRGHIGGNAYDCFDEAGVLIHQYGPHIFHTNDKAVFDYLSQFTKWRAYEHEVVANIPGGGGRMEIPVPFNLKSLRLSFPSEKAARLERKLLDTYGAGTKVTILQLRENTDSELRELAQYVYDHIFVRYTMKQWGQTPEEIDPAVTARVPVFLSEDCRYFQDEYQGMPQGGYTALFEAMLTHPNIEVRTGVDARDLLTFRDGAVLFDGETFTGDIVYTGAPDELFGCRFGRLPYRTLDFQFETAARDTVQTHGTVNYTMDEPYTRVTEFKYLTGQEKAGVTTTVKEFSRAYEGRGDETPYYAINNAETAALYQKYVKEASAYKNLYLLGRLAEYQYYNMDTIVSRALRLSGELMGH